MTSATLTGEAFTYDDNGNRTNTGYTTGPNNQVTADGTFDYTYDDEGNILTRTRILSNPADDYLTEYAWDHRNRLTKVTFKNNAGVATRSVSYTYDVNDLRIVKEVDEGDDNTIESAERYVYDRGDLTLVFDDFVLATGNSGDRLNDALTHRYMHGPAVDQVLSDERYDVADPLTLEELLWPLTDHQGTVRDLASYDAGTTSIVNHIEYDSFGNITAESDDTVDHAFGFTGRAWDDDVDLYYYRARWYDPAVGRFISEDPTGFAAGDANLYRYVTNSPLNFTDPSGLSLTSPLANVFSRSPTPSGFQQSTSSFAVARKVGGVLGGALGNIATALLPGLNELSTLFNSVVDIGVATFASEPPYLAGPVIVNDRVLGVIPRSGTDRRRWLQAKQLLNDAAKGGFLGHRDVQAQLTNLRTPDLVRQSGQNGSLKQAIAEQVILGNFSNTVTLEGTAIQIGASLTGLDFPADIRDISADLINFEPTFGHVGQTLLDMASLLPIVGVLKSADEVSTLLKQGSRAADGVPAVSSQRALLKKINTTSLTKAEKGTLGEARTALTLQRAGFQQLPSKLPRNQGFDGVFIKRGAGGTIQDIVVSESKFSTTGRASLSNTASKGRQLSDVFLRETIEQMTRSANQGVRGTGVLLRENIGNIRLKAAVTDPAGTQRFNRINVPGS